MGECVLGRVGGWLAGWLGGWVGGFDVSELGRQSESDESQGENDKEK